MAGSRTYAISSPPAGREEAEALAALHAASFTPGWSADAVARFLNDPCCICLSARSGEGEAAGMLILRVAGGEAEILTLAVAPPARCKGLGRRLIEAAIPGLRERGAGALFLEVGADNHAAAALYEKLGFRAVGSRKEYYARAGGRERGNARIMRLDLVR